MTRDELVNWVKSKLGYPVVDIEIPDSTIELCIDDALEEVNPWLPQEHVLTVQLTGPTVDLTPYDVGTIVDVAKSPNGIIDAQYLNPLDQAMADLTSQEMGYYKDNISYRLVNGILYIDTGYPPSSVITITYYIDENKVDVEDYTDKRYLKFLKDFALAFTRLILGDIRSKYTTSNSPVELDGESQTTKAQDELERLRQALVDADNPSVFITD